MDFGGHKSVDNKHFELERPSFFADGCQCHVWTPTKSLQAHPDLHFLVV